MQGSVSLVTDRSLRNAIARAYSARFQLGNLFAFTIRRSSLYCFTPSWVRYLDNSRRFGYKFELNLPADNSGSTHTRNSSRLAQMEPSFCPLDPDWIRTRKHFP